MEQISDDELRARQRRADRFGGAPSGGGKSPRIAGIWVAFFRECEQQSCEQVAAVVVVVVVSSRGMGSGWTGRWAAADSRAPTAR